MEHLLILPLLVDGLTGHSADINYVGNMSVIYNSSKCNYQGYMRERSLSWAYPVVTVAILILPFFGDFFVLYMCQNCSKHFYIKVCARCFCELFYFSAHENLSFDPKLCVVKRKIKRAKQQSL